MTRKIGIREPWIGLTSRPGKKRGGKLLNLFLLTELVILLASLEVNLQPSIVEDDIIKSLKSKTLSKCATLQSNHKIVSMS